MGIRKIPTALADNDRCADAAAGNFGGTVGPTSGAKPTMNAMKVIRDRSVLDLLVWGKYPAPILVIALFPIHWALIEFV